MKGAGNDNRAGGTLFEKNCDEELCEECDFYHNCTPETRADVARLAVKALEKQIPKKPEEYEDKYYACPVCDNVLMYKWEKYPSQLKDKKTGLPYCLSCGQAIDWSVENEID